MKGIKRTMETLLKFIFVAVLGVIFSIADALITTLFFYAGWNWGLVTAVSFAHPVTLFQAFWACLGLCSVGGMLKSGVKVD